MSENRHAREALGDVIERAWRDPAFKRRLLAEPEAVFAEAGVPVPAGRKIKIVEDSNAVSHFVLPTPPGDAGLTDADLDAVAGASLINCQTRAF